MDIFGDNGASDVIEKALQQIQGVPVPTAQSMQVQLQKLVQMGIITPDQMQAYLAGPNAFDNVKTSPLGTEAQMAAINKLQDIAGSGGMDAEEAAALQGVIQNLNTQERGQRGAILQGQAERGALTGGETLASQLEANQSDVTNANQTALESNAAAEQRALQALTTSGSMGAALEGQQFGEGAQKATAANAIEAFNAQQKQQAAQFNTSSSNAAKAANLSEEQRIADTNTAEENTNRTRNSDLVQQQFEDTLAKEKAAAGESGDLAKVDSENAKNSAGFVGNLIGTGGQAGGNALSAYLKGQGGVQTAAHGGVIPLKNGGQVPGTARVPGDSTENDTVPALLSPGEVVVPRTAAIRPDKTLEFLARLRRPKMPTSAHPADVATVLQALSHVRQGA